MLHTADPAAIASTIPWPAVATVAAALLAAVAATVGALLARTSDRHIRARIAKDIAAWEKLPAGSQPRREMFHLIGRQVAALTQPIAEARANFRKAAELSLLAVCAGGLAATLWLTAPVHPFAGYFQGVAFITVVAVALLLFGVGFLLRGLGAKARHRRTGA